MVGVSLHQPHELIKLFITHLQPNTGFSKAAKPTIPAKRSTSFPGLKIKSIRRGWCFSSPTTRIDKTLHYAFATQHRIFKSCQTNNSTKKYLFPVIAGVPKNKKPYAVVGVSLHQPHELIRLFITHLQPNTGFSKAAKLTIPAKSSTSFPGYKKIILQKSTCFKETSTLHKETGTLFKETSILFKETGTLFKKYPAQRNWYPVQRNGYPVQRNGYP